MPAERAASGLKPTARTSKPSRVRLRTTQNTSSIASEMKMPTCRPCSSGSPQKTGSLAPSTMSFDTGTDVSVSLWSGPPRPNRNTPIQIAIQLSMIVEITSLAPVVARSRPAIPPHAAPAAHAASMHRTMCSRLGIPENDEPTQTAANVPTRYCPWPPMLNRPQRNANATARPVSISGAAVISVCCRFSAATVRSSELIHGKNQLSPVPSKIAL
jgi:hypothetical protein